MDVRRTKIKLIRYAVDTGEKPFLCTGADNREYWCKNFDESTNGETVVNELVSYEVGRSIGAPVPSWAIIDPGDYAGANVYPEDGGKTRLTVVSRKPLFGSQCIQGVVASDDLKYLKRNSNPERIPRLMALWYLCNARDIQMLYQPECKDTIYSVDHGTGLVPKKEIEILQILQRSQMGNLMKFRFFVAPLKRQTGIML